MNEEGGGDHMREQLVRRLVRDLAELARSQARLTVDLMEFLEALERPPASGEIRLETEAQSADNPPRGVETSGSNAAGPTSPDAEAQQEPVAWRDPGAQEAVPLAAEDWGAQEVPDRDTPFTPTEEVSAASVATVSADASRETAGAETGALPAALVEEEEEGPETGEEEEDEESVVLTLESGGAKVGVSWDHVANIGSLPGPEVPESVAAESDGEPVDLVSLGKILHGVSRGERYFVVLSDQGERVAVAAERILGIGPLGAAVREHGIGKVQVLRVPMLRSFAQKRGVAPAAGGSQDWMRAREAEDERDRNGPLRALVAVRYLPARVAICRFLRGRGWQVGEAAGTEAASVSLDLGRWDALFLEAPSNGNAEDAEATLLRRVGERGIPIIRVGSRISGYPARGGPTLMFPFSEAELEAVLAIAGSGAGS